MRWCLGPLAACMLASFAQAQECAAPAKSMLRAELMFGRTIGGRLGVTEARWADFVARELTPRFPDGLSVFDARGQWRTPSGAVVREPSKIVLIVTANDTAARTRLDEAAAAYKQRFRQQSVGIVTGAVCAAF